MFGSIIEMTGFNSSISNALHQFQPNQKDVSMETLEHNLGIGKSFS